MKNILITIIAILGMVVIANAQTVPSYVPSSGLVGWWPFNGNANDESGSGNNGNVLSGATFSSNRFGISNTAILSPGDDTKYSGVEIPVNISTSKDFSLSIWFRTADSTKTNQTIFSTVPHTILGFGFNHIYTQGKISGYIGNGDGSWILLGPSNNWSPNDCYKWHNLVYIKNGNFCETYYDSKLVSNYGPVNLNVLITKLLIGTNGLSNNYAVFKGLLDDFGCWNRALTPKEISNLYKGCQLTVKSQPSSKTININNNAQFVVGSSDSNATYQWQTDLGVGFQKLNNVGQYWGSTNDTLTILNTTMSNNNQPFRCIVGKGACSDTSKVAVLTIKNNVGVNKFYENKLFSVYPNPAKNVINLNADLALIRATYIIYDNTGRSVLSGNINSVSTIIELGNLSGGNYVISIGDNIKQSFNVIK